MAAFSEASSVYIRFSFAFSASSSFKANHPSREICDHFFTMEPTWR